SPPWKAASARRAAAASARRARVRTAAAVLRRANKADLHPSNKATVRRRPADRRALDRRAAGPIKAAVRNTRAANPVPVARAAAIVADRLRADLVRTIAGQVAPASSSLSPARSCPFPRK